MRVWYMFTTLLFASKINICLKVEGNAQGSWRILYYKTNEEAIALKEEGETLNCVSCPPLTSLVL